MGMFDSVKIDIKCPYCDKKSEIECQTKELDCLLQVWKKGDYVGTDKLRFLDCIADCCSKECREMENKRIGYNSGFGRIFYVKIFLRRGVVTGKYEIYQTES